MAARPRYLLILTCLLLAALTTTGCEATGNVLSRTKTVRVGDAQKVETSIEMGAGRLVVESGARSLMEGQFETSYSHWEPEIAYKVDGSLGELSIVQPPMKGGMRTENIVNQWNIRLNDEVPMALSIALGAGQSEIDLTGMTLTDLDISVGAAEITLDLRGNWDQNLDVRMAGGVGKVLIRLPSRVGVRAEVRGGIGTIESTGLINKGTKWYNAAYGESDVTLDVDVEGGIGEIRLEVDEY